MSAILARLRRLWQVLRVLVGSGMIAPLRPDRYIRMGLAVRRYGINPTTGFGLAAARAPHAPGLIDERGTLTWGELDARIDALAVGLADGRPDSIAILCRNHRGFVEALVATSRLGADALLLNTGFSGPQLTDVLVREGAALIVYDEEFSGIVDEARERNHDMQPVLAWTDAPTDALTVDKLIDANLGRRPRRPKRPGRVVLLTSGTTGTPKGARRSGGGAGTLSGMLERIPWHAGESTVVAAPTFHAWGFGQLVISATMTCTVIMRRKFDPVATLGLVKQHAATGLAVVPVMLERIDDLPDDVLSQYDLPSLRFVTASGSRMRPDSVIAFMDRFGDVVYNSYNATEAGMITIATPEDLRHAPDTAGRPVSGTELRIVGDDFEPVPAGEVGKIVIRSDSQFDGYTSGDTKDFAEGYMVTGDLGRLDDQGRLYVVGRDDDMIVSGGENVYPLEIEHALVEHDGVREVAVIGVDDREFGQRLAAFVVRSPGSEVTADELKAHVKARLSGYKVPRDVTFLDELPRNASGKLVKRELTG